jgi:hypothetical protein
MKVKQGKIGAVIYLNAEELGFLRVIMSRYNRGKGATNVELNPDQIGNGFPAELEKELGK